MRDLPPESAGLGRRARSVALVLLALGGLAASALAARHLGALTLPGCGLESPCERLMASRWGTLPLAGWPTAFLGVSWFLALFSAWLVARGRWPRGLVWLVRAGALGSLGWLLAMALEHETCPYCVVAQLANLGFGALSERAARFPAGRRRPPVVFALVFLASTLVLAGLRGHQRERARERGEAELARSTLALLRGSQGTPFTGRYRLGPEQAAIRLVVISDYQCPDCARIERELQALVERRSDIALAAKHFPLCSECNPRARELGQNPHPNACWAARAAEAAGIVAGADGFWRMHRWLFAHRGAFTEEELRAGLTQLGFSAAEFLRELHGLETARRVAADVEEALALGIHVTPMIFVNGLELRGWEVPGALARAVAALAAAHPAPAGAEVDRPPEALEKFLEDWRLEPVRVLPPAGAERGSPERVPDDIVLWGDVLDAGTRELDRRIRDALAAHAGARYSFRNFPVDPDCNAGVPSTHPGACLATRATEAAILVGGQAAGQRLRAWLMQGTDAASVADLVRVAGEQGLDPAAFAGALDSEAALAALRHDIESARQLGITSIPFLFVAGKHVPRWKLEDFVERLLDEALD